VIKITDSIDYYHTFHAPASPTFEPYQIKKDMRIMQLCQFTLVLTFGFMLMGIQATSQTNYTFQDGKMTISGTSTLHDWTSDVTQINFEGTVQAGNESLASIKKVQLSIPVEGIKSTKGKTMDKKTWGALESETHPNIKCSLNSFDIQEAGNKFNITGKGELTIAGNTQPITLTFNAQFTEDGNLKFTGSKALKMTDFNIDPPRALLGTLKTGDDITIDFTVSMKPTNSSANMK
jgi:polyisoprenoid-binding protein YceI